MEKFTDEAGNPVDLAKLAEQLEATSIWGVRSIEDEPETKLVQWRVYTVENKDAPPSMHLVGYTGYEGRVCSAVKEYDPKTRKGVTQSGRVYELVGHSGYNGDAMYVWSRWLGINGNPKYEDVTDIFEKGYSL